MMRTVLISGAPYRLFSVHPGERAFDEPIVEAQFDLVQKSQLLTELTESQWGADEEITPLLAHYEALVEDTKRWCCVATDFFR